MRILLPIPSFDDGFTVGWVMGFEGPDAIAAERTTWDRRFRWQVSVAACEFVRDENDAGVLTAAVERALGRVPGVREIVHEDREIWLVAGWASGLGLLLAADRAVRRNRDLILAALS